MFDDLSIRFEEPQWLALIALVLPCYLVARRSIGGLSPLKTHITFAIRAVVITLLATALAHPTWLQRGEGLTVMLMLDTSRSVPQPLQQDTLRYFTSATTPDAGREPEDRLAVITIGAGAAISALPNRLTSLEGLADNLADHEATNLAAAVNLALATSPKDTAIRFVLASDGNETDERVLDAVKIAKANGIPIDVLPLQYEHGREVVFDRVVAPARARRGQVTSLQVIMRAQADTAGTLTLFQNGVPVDLDPGSPGAGIHIELAAGLNTRLVPILFDQAGPQQFEARFAPDDAASDLIVENNVANAVTFVGGEGRVLVIDDTVAESEALVAALQASDLSVDIQAPAHLSSIVTLAGYDAVILVNQPFGPFTLDMDEWLHDYVHDLGGGLIMTGGPDALGAGGWINSRTEEALPLKLDPPQNMQRQRGALALIMHSCEMPQANFWGLTIAETAIKALSSQDIVGILDYNYSKGGCVWEWGPDVAGDKSGPLAAAQSMPVGDMPDFQSAMQLAYNDLIKVNANRHCIITSDGDPSPPTQKLLNDFAAANITVTTVLLAGHGGPGTMQMIANGTGGRFYNPTNPRQLPEIIITETRMVARSLIVEDETYVPQLRNAASEPIRGFRDLPALDGYVLTAPKEGLAEIPFTEDKNGDPIYANWNYGIGKSVVFTSDVSGRWGSRWVSWDEFKGFWDQTVRWAMRPVTPANMTVNSRIEGERAIVEVEALDTDDSFLNNLGAAAAVLGPNRSEPLTMQQVGPGRYRGEFPVSKAGSYLVNMNFREGGELVGNLQAAVSVPYAREFRAIKDNFALMQAIASETGGRILPAEPLGADLWNRKGLEPRRSHLPIWDLLAIIAASIFVFDVAARRLAIGVADLRSAVGRMIGKRGEVKEDTVAAWKKARSQVAHRRDSKSAAASTASADRDVKFEADDASRVTAMDVGAGVAKEVSDRPAAPKRRDPSVNPSPQDEGDFTSRLLAAKKRARDQQQSGDKPSTGNDAGPGGVSG